MISNIKTDYILNTSASNQNDDQIDVLEGQLDQLALLAKEKYGAKADQLDQAIGNFKTALHGTKKDDKNPFSFANFINVSLTNAYTALAFALNELVTDQTGIIVSDMGIVNELIGPQVNSSSTYWIGVIQNDVNNLNNKNLQPWQIALYQGQLTEDNSESQAYSTYYNGVMTQETQGVSTKQSSITNLLQEVSQVVTAGYNAMAQNWVNG